MSPTQSFLKESFVWSDEMHTFLFGPVFDSDVETCNGLAVRVHKIDELDSKEPHTPQLLLTAPAAQGGKSKNE
jgi:hypothetical protein